MLTIRAMAEMGPWTLSGIDVLEGRVEHCRRCNTKIKNVWVMVKETDGEIWRIGNECGPHLEDMVRELWDKVAKPFDLSLRHFTTLERLIRCEREIPTLAPTNYRLGWAAEQQAKLSAAVLTDRERRVMGRQVSQALTAWEISFRKHEALAAKSTNSLPTNAHQ